MQNFLQRKTRMWAQITSCQWRLTVPDVVLTTHSLTKGNSSKPTKQSLGYLFSTINQQTQFLRLCIGSQVDWFNSLSNGNNMKKHLQNSGVYCSQNWITKTRQFITAGSVQTHNHGPGSPQSNMSEDETSFCLTVNFSLKSIAEILINKCYSYSRNTKACLIILFISTLRLHCVWAIRNQLCLVCIN